MYSLARRTASVNCVSFIVEAKPSSPSASNGPGAVRARGAGARTGRAGWASGRPKRADAPPYRRLAGGGGGARGPGARQRLELPEQFAYGRERVAVGQPLRSGAALEREASVLRREDHERIGAEERVARPDLAALHRLEQERVGTGAEPQVRGERGVEIRRQLGEHRHKVPLCRESAKLVTGRGEGRDDDAGGTDA